MSSGKWRPFCLGLKLLTFGRWDRNIPGKLCQYRGVIKWVIKPHGIDYVGLSSPSVAKSSTAMALVIQRNESTSPFY